MTINIYKKDWNKFRRYIEQKAKGKCVINNKNWLKLRDYHFKQFIKTVPQPYGLVFKMIYMSKIHKNIPCIHRVYYKHKKERDQQCNFRDKSKASAYRKYR